jgi:hypothetical protein
MNSRAHEAASHTGLLHFYRVFLLKGDVLDVLSPMVKLLKRKPNPERITAKKLSFVKMFISGVGVRL